MTSQKPRRTMLPPNLTRNYHEVQRLIAEGEGRELPHWYQLTAEQKLAQEREVELFRRAILRAEEEQDLVASFNAPAAPAPPTAESTEAAAPAADPECFICAVAHALNQRAGCDVGSSGQDVVYVFEHAFLTSQERADGVKRANEAIAQWLAGNPMTGIPAPGLGGLDGFSPRFSDLWLEFGKQQKRQPFPPKV
ncbi:hypothetical protein [Streptomyces similanensis]|uniref:Uncharacterized protein n=1 Tax=Streptomyces similanensis TaxID=1274988 RepID=A0ABP9L7R3_9ACTN